MPQRRRFLLTGGGSGGHITPNLAIATALRSRCRQNRIEPDLLYVGSRSPMDRALVVPSGIPFRAIFTGKLRRYFSWRNFADPFLLVIGFFQSLWILIRFRPHAVFAKGGFVSLPVALAAFLLRRPVILHESDRVMGLANRLIAKLADRVCMGFPDTFAGKKAVFTGNPVRLSIADGNSAEGYRLTGFRPEKPVVLVWGGSQGAQQINELLGQSFVRLKGVFQIVHITGRGKSPDLNDPAYCPFEYLDESLKHIYAITDLVVGRAGANSLYELALMKKPNILIPLQSAAGGHQQMNAEYFETKGASLILRDEPLHEMLAALWHNPAKQKSMRNALASLARPASADDIATIILERGRY